jgi:hypothetical protein
VPVLIAPRVVHQGPDWPGWRTRRKKMTNTFNRCVQTPLIDPFWFMVWAIAIDNDRQERERKRREREWLEFLRG